MCLVTCKFHLVLFSLNSLITSIHIPALTTTCLEILSKNSLSSKNCIRFYQPLEYLENIMIIQKFVCNILVTLGFVTVSERLC